MDLQKYQKVIFHLLVSGDYRLVRKHRIFDSGYYLEHGSGAGNVSIDPLWDYLKRTGDDYVDLLHTSVWRQQADPHPLFDTGWYLLRYFPDGLPVNPLVHYLREGWLKGFWPGPYLAPPMYRQNSGWREHLGDPLTHYTHVGSVAFVNPSPYFDVGWYLDRNPVLRDVKHDIIKHYKLHGARILKSPVPLFDPAFYLSQLDDPEPGRTDPMSSFASLPHHSQLKPNEWFDPVYYRDKTGGEGDSLEPFAHYLQSGVYDKKIVGRAIAEVGNGPKISILVPVYDPDIGVLNNCIRSVLYQAYPNWELCLADDCSRNPMVRASLESWSARDQRIKTMFREENGGISAATNSAAELADGDYFGFLDNDDELSTDCLFRVAQRILESGAQIIYSDEDLIGDDGTRLSVFHKPDFNLGLLFTHNYITHFVAVERNLFQEIGGFDSGCDGAQDYDLLLRLTEHTARVEHIARVLYHWRASQTSTSINHSQKSYAHEAGKKALEASISRRRLGGTAEDSGTNFFYRLNYTRQSNPEISVLVHAFAAGHERDERLSQLRSNTAYDNCGFTGIVTGPGRTDGGANPMGTPAMAELLHEAASRAKGEVLVFLSADITGADPSWLEAMLGPLLQGERVGLVCGRLDTDGEGKASHRIPDLDDESTDYFSTFLAKSSRHMNWLHCSQYVSFCDWDVCMIRSSLYAELGGLDWDRFPHRLAMLDLSLRVTEQGWNILYTPYALMHAIVPPKAHSGAWLTTLQREKREFQKKWKTRLHAFDRYYNLGILEESGLAIDEFYQWLGGESPERKP